MIIRNRTTKMLKASPPNNRGSVTPLGQGAVIDSILRSTSGRSEMPKRPEVERYGLYLRAGILVVEPGGGSLNALQLHHLQPLEKFLLATEKRGEGGREQRLTETA